MKNLNARTHTTANRMLEIQTNKYPAASRNGATLV